MTDATRQDTPAFPRLRRALIASHVVETVEHLCDRVVILQPGRVVRTLPRAAWGRPEHGPSPLEREFLSTSQNPSTREDPR